MEYVTGKEIKNAELSKEFLLSCLPKGFRFYEEPWYHQLVSIVFALQFDDGVGFWHDMAGGKTACAINTIRAKGLRKGVVLTVKAALVNWKNEFKKHSGDEYKIAIAEGSSDYKNDVLSEDADVYIINYEGIFKRIQGLTKEQRKHISGKDYILQNLNRKWDFIIYDESRLIMSLKSIRTKVSLELAWQSKYRIPMSGLPIAKSIDEIYSQQYCIDLGETFGTYRDFRREYFQVQMKKIGWNRSVREWVPKEDAEENIHEKMYQRGIRYTKEECHDLPEKIFQYRYLELEGDQKKFYYELAERESKTIYTKRSAREIRALAIKFQQIVGGFLIAGYDREGRDVYKFKDNIKLKESQYLLEGELAKEKVLIAASFIEEQHGIIKFLNSIGIPTKGIIAGMKSEEVDNVIKEFSNTDLRCIVISRKVGGKALNITAGAYQIDYSRDPDYDSDRQMQDRSHRPGQKRNMTYIRLVCQNTVDVRIQEILDNNENLVNKVLEGGGIGRFLYGKK
jgi:SNF2 family DNA or RNA helicase